MAPISDSGSKADSIDSKLPTSPQKYRIIVYPEDGVDFLNYNDNGLVKVGRTTYCTHGRSQKCTNCLDKDPWDGEYLKEKGIKHHSMHSELKRLTQYHGKSKSIPCPLNNVKCTVKAGCTTHKPYPEACCSHCQPGTLMLDLQKYRHVDYIEFESTTVVGRFIDYWRKTGKQRAGILIGRYDKYDGSPLGIKATVCNIYEPPQESATDCIRLLEDFNDEQVDALLKALNLKRVGWIFTDLEALPQSPGKVRYTRTPDTYFLTAQECITAGYYQNMYRQASRYSVEGYFGSRFVTAVVSGDQDNQIQVHAWQVSDQCTALVEAQLLVPVSGRPELAYVRPQNRPAYRNQYIPQVLYTKTDQYKNKVQREGRPVPVEFFLVDVPNGTPLQTDKMLAGSTLEYPIENRTIDAADSMTFVEPSLTTLAEYLSKNKEPHHVLLANWHLIHFLATNNSQMTIDCQMTDDQLLELCAAVISKSAKERVSRWVAECQPFTNLTMIANEALHNGAGDGAASGQVSCPQCTFLNKTNANDCAMCGLPLK